MRRVRFTAIFPMIACFMATLDSSLFQCAAEEPSTDEVQERFVGNYRLLSFFRYPVRGEPVEVKMIGRIMYDGHGNMAAQLQPNGFKSLAGDAEARGRRGGYVAYFGRYEIDADENRVTHKVIGANIPAWAGDENDFGNDNVRFFEFDGDRLKLSLKDRSGRVTGTLTWQRFQ